MERALKSERPIGQSAALLPLLLTRLVILYTLRVWSIVLYSYRVSDTPAARRDARPMAIRSRIHSVWQRFSNDGWYSVGRWHRQIVTDTRTFRTLRRLISKVESSRSTYRCVFVACLIVRESRGGETTIRNRWKMRLENVRLLFWSAMIVTL